MDPDPDPGGKKHVYPVYPDPDPPSQQWVRPQPYFTRPVLIYETEFSAIRKHWENVGEERPIVNQTAGKPT
jgi:hypothetical protein